MKTDISELKVYKHIDWLTITWAGRQYPETVLPMHEGFDIGDKTNGGAFYQTAYKLACGATYGYSDSERQGIILMLPGQALAYLRERGFTDQKLVGLACTGRNVSRLDYALDVIGGTRKDHSPESTHNAYKDGKIKTRLNMSMSIKDEASEDGGFSVYFGSPKSDQRIRVYDKAAQQKIMGLSWTRVEAVLKGDYSRTLAEDMQTHGVITAGDSKLKKLWDADIEWFQDALAKELIEPGEVPNKQTNFPRWLNTTVYPSIKNHIETNRDDIANFHKMIGFLLRDS